MKPLAKSERRAIAQLVARWRLYARNLTHQQPPGNPLHIAAGVYRECARSLARVTKP